MTAIGICVPTGQPLWSREAQIGDYGGELNKEDSRTESDEPYAAGWYRELHSMRGSAYTTAPRTIVDAENLALARFWAGCFSRNAEKVRANATPARADERIPYWADVLGVPHVAADPTWLVRQRCTAHYMASVGPTAANVSAACSALLGSAFVAVHTTSGSNLAAPPTNTYWPGVNPGSDTYSLGGGMWSSPRCHLWVETTIPAGMSLAEYDATVRVQAQQLLDRMLPAWATYSVSRGTGFILGTSLLGYDALTGA